VGQISGGDSYNYAFYTQADYWLHEKVKLIVGGQANKDKNTDLDNVPRAGLILYPLENTGVKLLYSQAFRAPSLNERFMNFAGLSGYLNIKPEKVETIDIGVNYQKEKLMCGVNYFVTKQSNIIQQDRSGKVFATPTYNNVGEIKAHGVEVEGTYYINKEFMVLGSLLNQNNEDQSGVKDVSPIANTSAKLGFSYKSDKGVILSLFDAYQGNLDSKFDAAVNPSPGAYSLANLHGRFDMKKLAGWNIGRDFAFLLQVDNLLDKQLWLPDWGAVYGSSLPVNQGRTVYFGVEISL
jgi:outer membrane receptor for ferrienterochelin and colicins